MGEKLTLDSSGWSTYRSRFRCRAQRIAPEGVPIGAPVSVPLEEGRTLKGKIGDYLVELDDGRLEFWTPDRFDREMELDAAPAVELEVRR